VIVKDTAIHGCPEEFPWTNCGFLKMRYLGILWTRRKCQHFPGSEQKMAYCTLQSLFREPRKPVTDRAAFVQAVSRLSTMKSKKEVDALKCAKCRPKAA